MSFSPKTGLVYIPALDIPFVYATTQEPFKYATGGDNSGTAYDILTVSGELAGIDTRLPSISSSSAGQPDPHARTILEAWDPVRQRRVWMVNTATDSTGSISADNAGGVISTGSGLVFQGQRNRGRADESLREILRRDHVQQDGGRLGQTPGRCSRRCAAP
jgi:quinohemoprotein ethanol dehydrogenase